ncbi:unnamed protein product [Owenia fusiformis]|uniref:5-formyltetrahydrofolate cyclo-ligase n=1 Tax=Owenia fusiformis TaxID=6347 RepID=A0A8J1T5I7_OWEFU|nr:unnamed protein product [Owenia fusiformis]
MALASIHAAKKILRKKIKDTINALSREEKERQSSVITQKLIALPVYQQSTRISVFLSMQDEINTMHILSDIFRSGKICFIPCYHGDNMDMLKLNSMADYDSLPVTKWNIKQPNFDDDRENALTTGGLDLILMPGLGFSKEGARLGRGKGYYDNYLRKCVNITKKKPITVALAFKEQIIDDIPVTESDVPIDTILYEQ